MNIVTAILSFAIGASAGLMVGGIQIAMARPWKKEKYLSLSFVSAIVFACSMLSFVHLQSRRIVQEELTRHVQEYHKVVK